MFLLVSLILLTELVYIYDEGVDENGIRRVNGLIANSSGSFVLKNS